MNAPEDPIQTPPTPTSPGYKRCPYCAEETPANEKKCAHCDEFVDWREPPYRGELSWYEKQMINTPAYQLFLILVALPLVTLLLGLIGVLTCKQPEARKRATLLLLASAIAIVVTVLLGFVMLATDH